MLGWLTPKCPVNACEKVVIEQRFAKLLEVFGSERTRSAEVVLPTREFFPAPFTGTPECVPAVLEPLCRALGIRAEGVVVEFFDSQELGQSAWIATPGSGKTVRLTASHLGDQYALVGEITGQLARAMLVDARYSASEVDAFAELLPVFLGLGVFSANTRVREGHSGSTFPTLSPVDAPGPMSSRGFGYANALFAWLRGESQPDWIEFLGLDARAATLAGLKYLRKTEDCLFTPQRPKPPALLYNADDATDKLRSRYDGERLGVLWGLQSQTAIAEAVLDEIVFCLGDHNEFVRAGATMTVARIGSAALHVLPEIVVGLTDSSSQVRAASALAMGLLRPSLETIGSDGRPLLTDMASLLRDESRDVLAATADALARFGSEALDALPPLLAALRKALVHCDEMNIGRLVHAIVAICPDAESTIAAAFAEPSDEGLWHQVQAPLADAITTDHS